MKTPMFGLRLLSIGIFIGGFFGCASAGPMPRSKYFEAVLSMPLGSEKSRITKVFGQPSQVKSEKDGNSTYIYSFLHMGVQIPKATFWIDRDDKMIGKLIWLYELDNDVKTRIELESILKNSKFLVKDAPAPKDGHNIPSEKYLHDDANGIFVEINTAQLSRANYIHWTLPKDDAKVTSSSGK